MYRFGFCVSLLISLQRQQHHCRCCCCRCRRCSYCRYGTGDDTMLTMLLMMVMMMTTPTCRLWQLLQRAVLSLLLLLLCQLTLILNLNARTLYKKGKNAPHTHNTEASVSGPRACSFGRSAKLPSGPANRAEILIATASSLTCVECSKQQAPTMPYTTLSVLALNLCSKRGTATIQMRHMGVDSHKRTELRVPESKQYWGLGFRV